MGVMPVGKLLVSMAAPLMASMLFQALYNIVDSVFVAKVSQDALNAVSLAFPIQSMVIAFGAGTGVGMGALVSRSLGAKDQEGANRAANTGIFLYFCTALLFAVVCVFLAEPFFRFQTQNEAIVRYGTQYITVCMGFSFAIFAQICFERLLQSTGRTNLAMISQISGAVFNMIMDPILIFGLFGFPRLEVQGAAVATVCGQCLGATIGLILNIKKNREIQLHIKSIRPHRFTIAQIYKISFPSIVMQSIGSVMNFFLNNILIGFTEVATAVFGAYYKIQSFIFMPIFGLNNALVPIIAFNMGAMKPGRVKETVKRGMIISISIMVFGCLMFESIPAILLSLFSPSAEMLQVGVTAFRIIGIHFPIAGFCIIAGSVCQAMGKPAYTLITNVCRQLLVLLPVAYLLSLFGRLELVWLAFPISESISLLLNVVFLKKTYKTML